MDLQLIFSLLFIEQKHGWGGIMAGIPIYNISDPKKSKFLYERFGNFLPIF